MTDLLNEIELLETYVANLSLTNFSDYLTDALISDRSALGDPHDVEMRLLKSSLNSFFLVIMAIIIFLMQAGFAFLEAGSVRSKNTTNILIKNLLDSCISALAYWLIGWSLAYGNNGNSLFGCGQWLGIGMTGHDYARWFFQFVFAATASTIVSGALAERCEFVAYLAYSAFLSAFVYPILSHWCWHEHGWLVCALGDHVTTYIDFAGSGVVHLCGGTCALVGAIILGPRIGYDSEQGDHAIDLKGHSVPFAALGGFILMFGFFAFNGGSQLSVTEPEDGEIIARAIMNTMLAGATAGMASLLINKLCHNRKWSLLITMNATLAGMVASCAGCNRLYPWASVLLGLGAALFYRSVSFGIRWLHIDDPIDAVAVHAGGGFWGLFMTPIFMKDTGIIYAQNLQSLLFLSWNLMSALAIVGWSVVTMLPLFWLLRKLKLLRVPVDVETKGLDIYKHGEPAYPLVAYGHGWVEDIVKNPHYTHSQKQRHISETAALGSASVSVLHHRSAMSTSPTVYIADQFDSSELHAIDQLRNRSVFELPVLPPAALQHKKKQKTPK